MLSKKILHLKKKIKKIEENYLNNFFDQKLLILKNKIDSQEKTIKDLECKVVVLEENIEKEYSNNKKGIKLILDSIAELEDYREICSNDITTLASAVTELYNILNYLLGGKLLIKKESASEDEIFFKEDLEFEDFVDDLDDDSKKKKKKVYH